MLRLGLLTEGAELPAWQARAIQEALNVPGVECVLRILAGGSVMASPGPGCSGAAALRFYLGRLLWGLYKEWALLPRSSSLRRTDLAATLAGVPNLPCPDGASGAMEDDFLKKVRSFDLDVLLAFVDPPPPAPLLTIPRFGVWMFSNPASGELSGFRELISGGQVTCVSLYRRVEEKGQPVRVLREGHFGVTPRSLRETLDRINLESSAWAASVCREVIQKGALVEEIRPAAQDSPPAYPTTLDMVALLGRQAVHQIRSWFERTFTYIQWEIGYCRESASTLLERAQLGDVSWLQAPPSPHYLADPFGIQEGDRVDVYAERYDQRAGRGHIVRLGLVDNEWKTRLESVLELPIHVSYPSVIIDPPNRYLAPETAQAREVALYREMEPGRWTKQAVLLEDGAYVDPTLFRFEDRWWLFCTVLHPCSDGNSQLYAWHAHDLHGPWIPHLRNPIKCDVRSSRPAGTPFWVGDVLYRPAQDCSRTYGGGIVLNRLLSLTPDDFSEETVATIQPPAGYRGCHHLAVVGQGFLVDAKRRIFSLRALLHRWQGPRAEASAEPYDGREVVFAPGEARPATVGIEGVDADGWTSRSILIEFVNDRLDGLRITLDLPGWSGLAAYRAALRLNGRTVARLSLAPGTHQIPVGGLRLGGINRIQLRFSQDFLMPPPDSRRRAARLCKMVGEPVRTE